MAEVDLHEATQAEDGVVETAVCQILLSARLHLHQRHLRMFVTVVDREEHVSLDTHCLQGRACCDLTTHAKCKQMLLSQMHLELSCGRLLARVAVSCVCDNAQRAWRCM